MAWFQVYKSGVFDFVSLSAEDLDLEVIAHALSMQCRFNGHCDRFYSVAEHSVHVALRVRELLPDDAAAARAGLLHDASEAVLGDIPSPLKRSKAFDQYRELERLTQEAILVKLLGFNRPPRDAEAIIGQADLELLATEKEQICGPEPRPWGLLPKPLRISIFGWDPATAAAEFLAAAESLGIAT